MKTTTEAITTATKSLRHWLTEMLREVDGVKDPEAYLREIDKIAGEVQRRNEAKRN